MDAENFMGLFGAISGFGFFFKQQVRLKLVNSKMKSEIPKPAAKDQKLEDRSRKTEPINKRLDGENQNKKHVTRS